MVAFVRRITGRRPKDWHLYAAALTHSSYDPSGRGVREGERLEYLGDALLGAIIAASVYRLYPDEDEGGLTQLRAFLCSREQINKLALSIGIEEVLRMSPDIDPRESDVPGNALEALIGALYLDRGFDATADFVRKQVVISRKRLERVTPEMEDPKSAFIIRMQQSHTPYLFDYLGETEPKPGVVRHHVALRMGDPLVVIAEGSGPSKKAADRAAARAALERLEAK